jgi:hypothetical protein
VVHVVWRGAVRVKKQVVPEDEKSHGSHIRNTGCTVNDRDHVPPPIDLGLRTPRADRGEAQGAVFADSSQAGYFRRVLAEQRAELDARLDNELRTLSARAHAGSTFGVKALRRRVREMQKRRKELDRLIDALGDA